MNNKQRELLDHVIAAFDHPEKQNTMECHGVRLSIHLVKS